MGALPGLGIESVSLALAGRLFSSEPPGKPNREFYWHEICIWFTVSMGLFSIIEHLIMTLFVTLTHESVKGFKGTIRATVL